MKRCAFVCAVFAVLVGARVIMVPTKTSEPQTAEPDGSVSAVEAPAACDTLFPSLDVQSVEALSVVTPERTFQFAADGDCVSVNGQLADEEAFATLVEEITALPVFDSDAFSPEGTPLMTLTIDCGDCLLSAAFYEQQESDAYANVVFGEDGEWLYRETNAWQVGKLMLICDGTRIQDASGNETPADH